MGVKVTPQAVEQRFCAELVLFLQKLFERAANMVVQSQARLAPLLDRFTDVLLIDSTTISLPPELADAFSRLRRESWRRSGRPQTPGATESENGFSGRRPHRTGARL